MAQNSIELRNIASLGGMDFYVPDYQRGYRWGETEITNLLEDLNEFCQKKIDRKLKEGEFYCLQPVVARKKTWTDGAGRQKQGYEIMDGQQRLTTIYIILKYLVDINQLLYPNFEPYSLAYETRGTGHDSAAFLANIAEAGNADVYIDFYYMKNAWKIINDWFEKYPAKKRLMSDILLNQEDSSEGGDNANNVRIIWYDTGDLGDREAVDMFTRLNVGKIPLTNAELVKALLLRGVNADDSSLLEISRNWDEIEQKLRDNKFWRFLRKSNAPDYESRIEYILELVPEKYEESDDAYHIFNEFNGKYLDLAKEKTPREAVLAIWKKIRDTFRSLEEMYEDRELYHKIGFLVETGVDIRSILKEYANYKKDKFRDEFLESLIAQKFRGINIDNLDLGANRAAVRMALLLFNILTVQKDENSQTRFPFDIYKDGNWDVEHITSQTDYEIRTLPEQREFVDSLLRLFAGTANSDLTRDYLAELKESETEPERAEFLDRLLDLQTATQKGELELQKTTELFRDLQKFFGEGNADQKDHISNLALLDASTNRSYKNAFFPVKRARVIDNDKIGSFVPQGTKNVFLKYYTPRVDEMLRWNKEDAANYQNEIENVLNPFLEK